MSFWRALGGPGGALGGLWGALGRFGGALQELWEVLRGLYTETPDQPHSGRYVN